MARRALRRRSDRHEISDSVLIISVRLRRRNVSVRPGFGFAAAALSSDVSNHETSARRSLSIEGCGMLGGGIMPVPTLTFPLIFSAFAWVGDILFVQLQSGCHESLVVAGDAVAIKRPRWLDAGDAAPLGDDAWALLACGAGCCANGRAWMPKDTINTNQATPMVATLALGKALGTIRSIPGMSPRYAAVSASHTLRSSTFRAGSLRTTSRKCSRRTRARKRIFQVLAMPRDRRNLEGFGEFF